MESVRRTQATERPQRPDPRGPLDTRLLTLASLLESLPDIRDAAATPPDAELTALLDQLTRLTRYLQQRQDSAQWDAADLLAARITLQVLAAIAVHMRRIAAITKALLGKERDLMRDAAREAAHLQAIFTEHAEQATREV